MFISWMINVGLMVSILFTVVDCTCNNLPLTNGNWWDSRVNKAITINTGTVTDGWGFSINSQQFDTFSCTISDDSRWVFRSDNTIELLFGANYYAFYCLQYTYLTDNSYMYYVQSDIEQFNGERVYLVDTSSANNNSVEAYCSPDNGRSGPDIREYHVFVKENTQNSVHQNQYFPDPLLGVFSYTVNDGSNTFCGAESVWDGCYDTSNSIDRTTVILNYTQCSTTLMGAVGGKLYNVANVTESGSTYYVILINADGVDPIFTCLAVSQSGNTRYISTNPGGCAWNQTSTSRTGNADSVLITMTAYETCLFTTTTSTTTTTTTTPAPTTTGVTLEADTKASENSDGSNTGVIVGVVLSLLLLIAIIVIAFLLYQKYFKKRKAHIQHMTLKDQGPDIKRPLPPDSDFTLSELNLKREPTMSDDLVIDSLSPRGKALPMERVLSRASAPYETQSSQRNYL
ncbi:Hypothetical predicted protein [Mytilus galloprovincialis]|uniref:DUF7042 domain-containing protein n=1 Tax=Mytilus galloprovincialis TaxID=29158 RepID=A0A8B6H2N8_MYTGA|nr:Hypothetical predicted protein [Mytilus galloprovincialis]